MNEFTKETMSTLKQILANRRNARKSSGATTPEGKAIDRLKAKQKRASLADCAALALAAPFYSVYC